MYKIYGKTAKAVRQNSLLHFFLQKQETILTVWKRIQNKKKNLFALSNGILFISI